MSGQAGIWNISGKPADRGDLERLSLSLSQYGPDGAEVHVSGPAGLVYRPFHTTLESRREHQPYLSIRGNVFTWDGRLDNREDLLLLLRDELNCDQTDVAIVAAGMEKWGTPFLTRIIGDWALSVWKPDERELILARDYVGIRRLFYYATSSRILWSSDLASLLYSDHRFTIDEQYVAGYLAHYPEAHLTPFQEIRSVPPGSFVCLRERGLTVHKYWHFNPAVKIRYKTDAEYEEHFRQVFWNAVRRRLRSDSPILAELSGGLDSSSIVCVADDILANGGAPAPRLETISWYDSKEPTGDERPFIARVEEKRGRAGLHFDTSQYADGFSFRYRRFVPIPGFLPGAPEAEAERLDFMETGGFRAVLSGVGGDEFMGGLPDPRPQLADMLVQFRFIQLAKALMAWSLVQRRPWIHLLLDTLSGLLPDFLAVRILQEGRVDRWITPQFARRQRFALRRLGPKGELKFVLPGRRALARTLILKSQEMTNTAPRSLGCEEKRYPYLDQSLVEFILAIPQSQLLRPGQRRSLMRRALANIVPSEILCRRTKGTSARLQMVTLDAHWREMEDVFENPISSRLDVIDSRLFREALVAMKNGELRNMVPAMRTIFLEVWLREILARDLIRLPNEALTCTETLAVHET